MAVINTNVKALFSQAALKATERNQQVSMQQLSTGKRINTSRDDAAGMAIATRMTHQIRSLNQAVRNAGDAITLIQTAEGATNEITDMMQRMRELAIQASNDTNNNEQRSYLDLEFQQLKKQIVQIADNTEWNGFPVLNGSSGERVGIKPVYKTISDPTVKADIQVAAGKPTSSSVTTRTGAVNEKGDVTFPVLNAGQSVTVAGLTYTAINDRSAAEVAAAFVGLADGATTGTGTANGTYSGKMVSWSTTGNSVSTATLTFNSSTPITNVTDLVATATPTMPTVVTTQGIATAVTEAAAVTFKDLAAGQSVQVAGLTFTAISSRTAAEVAAAFHSLSAGGAGSAVGGVHSFTGTLTGYNAVTAGAVTTFTSTSAGAVVADISVTTTSNNSPTVAITQGTPTVTETSDITFGPLTNGQSVVLNGLKFTASRSVSSAEVAAAFAGLGASATTGPATSYGAYTGTLTGFTTSAVLSSGIAVKATSSTGTTNVTDITVGPTPLPTISKTDGVAGTLDGVTEESVLTFPAMSKGQTVTVAGLTYTATVANSGAEVAAAFANLTSGAATGPSTKGTYSGALAAFNSGKVNGSSDVTFSSTTRFSTATDITVSSGTTVAGGAIALSPTVSTKQGVAGGGIVLGGVGAFAKSGSLSVVAAGPSSVRSATFTLDDGQILDLNVSSAVSISAGVVTIDKTALERAGINILSGGNVTLSQFTPAAGAAAFAANEVIGLSVARTLPRLEQMFASDVIINGIPIGASREADDTISPQGGGNQIASAIAKAAAINAKTVATGVYASVNPTIMTGAAMSGTGQAKGTLNINGFTTPMINTVLDNPRDSRIAAVNAINFISAQTGIRAIDSLTDSKGIMLVADDGRNVEVTFNTASTDADFSRLTGLKQGVQTGTFSLESMVETPINITSATNGNIRRAGLETVNYDSKTLSTVTTKLRPEVNSVNEIKSLGINDLMINGVAIRPALPADDTLSVTQSLSSKASASAIATAAAINVSTAKTGVTAVPVPSKINGDVTSTALPSAATLAATADSTVSLFINGKNIPIVMSTTQTEAERRTTVVNAITANAGLTGVGAVDNGNGGVTLKAVDGRNVSVWFDSDKVNAGSFGLGSGTVTNTPDGLSAIAGGNINSTSAATIYASVSLQSDKAIKVEPGNNGFTEQANFSNLGFSQGTFGGVVNEATSKMSPPRTGRLAFQVGANEGQKITIDLADFGKGGPITGEITWDADLAPLPPGAVIPEALPGGPTLQGKPLTRTSISSSVAAQEVLKKLDTAMDKVNQTRATMGAVMNRLDHVINNLSNVSMNLSASRSQIEDADYASASTEMAKTQIMQQAATAVLAQANTSQQSVLKLLQG
jgi:flagellin